MEWPLYTYAEIKGSTQMRICEHLRIFVELHIFLYKYIDCIYWNSI